MQSGQIGRPQEEQETRGLAVRVAVTGLGHRDRGAYNRAARWRDSTQPRPPLRDRWSARCSSSLGIVGFFYSASFGTPGRGRRRRSGSSRVNGWLNLVHIAHRRARPARRRLRRAPLRARARRPLHRARALGLRRSAAATSILGFIPVNTEDNSLHLVARPARARRGAGHAEARRRTPAAADAARARAGRSSDAQAALGLLAAAAAQLEQDQGAGGDAAGADRDHRAAPSCAGRAAPAARSRRAPRPSRRAPRRPPG